MRIDYDVGDCVVCVDDNPHPNAPPPLVVKGGFYKVEAIEEDLDGYLIVKMLGVPTILSIDTEWWLDANRFRKLPKASDEFTEQMRKMKPHKQKVDARCPITGQPLSVREMFESECG